MKTSAKNHPKFSKLKIIVEWVKLWIIHSHHYKCHHFDCTFISKSFSSYILQFFIHEFILDLDELLQVISSIPLLLLLPLYLHLFSNLFHWVFINPYIFSISKLKKLQVVYNDLTFWDILNIKYGLILLFQTFNPWS